MEIIDRKPRLPSQPFGLLVKPASADCNLRCSYCFYLDGARGSPRRMSNDVLERVISSYMRTSQPQYSFGWQGGEPALMGLSFFERATELQRKHGNSGASVANALQTNGMLIDDSFAAHLARNNFLVGVSIDGPPGIHDHYRRRPGGAGSHAPAINALQMLKRHGVEHNTLTLVSNINVNRPIDIYHYLCDQGILFHQYIECVEFDNAGRLQPFAVRGGQWGDFLCALFDEWFKHDVGRVSIRLFDSIITMLVDGIPSICSMGTECSGYVVVEYTGDIYQCDFYVKPELKLGNITTQSWNEILHTTRRKKFAERKRRWHKKCARCSFLRLCAGDCTKNRPGHGRDPTRLSVLCPGWRQFYNHSIDRFMLLANDIDKRRRADQPVFLTGRGANTGRNSPCPCGSGKKYKRCCGFQNT